MSIVDSCPATAMVTLATMVRVASTAPVAAAPSAPCGLATATLLTVIAGNSAASSTAALNMFCRVPDFASSGTAAAKSAPSSARARASSTSNAEDGTLSQNEDASAAPAPAAPASAAPASAAPATLTA